MKRWFTALIALIIGGVIGYAYKQGEVSSLTQQLAALKTEVTDANAAATAQIDELKTELEAKSKLAEEQQAEILELQAATRMDEMTAPTTATPPPLRLSPDLPTTPPAPQ
jgi:uncharacterized protein HemX